MPGTPNMGEYNTAIVRTADGLHAGSGATINALAGSVINVLPGSSLAAADGSTVTLPGGAGGGGGPAGELVAGDRLTVQSGAAVDLMDGGALRLRGGKVSLRDAETNAELGYIDYDSANGVLHLAGANLTLMPPEQPGGAGGHLTVHQLDLPAGSAIVPQAGSRMELNSGMSIQVGTTVGQAAVQGWFYPGSQNVGGQYIASLNGQQVGLTAKLLGADVLQLANTTISRPGYLTAGNAQIVKGMRVLPVTQSFAGVAFTPGTPEDLPHGAVVMVWTRQDTGAQRVTRFAPGSALGSYEETVQVGVLVDGSIANPAFPGGDTVSFTLLTAGDVDPLALSWTGESGPNWSALRDTLTTSQLQSMLAGYGAAQLVLQ